MHFDFVAGDTASKLRVTCKDNDTGAVINLSGATVVLRWRNATDTATIERVMNIVNAAAGLAEHQFTSGELFGGVVRFEVRITDSGGAIMHNVDLVDASVRVPLA